MATSGTGGERPFFVRWVARCAFEISTGDRGFQFNVMRTSAIIAQASFRLTASFSFSAFYDLPRAEPQVV